jgi:hypothetical protein
MEIRATRRAFFALGLTVALTAGCGSMMGGMKSMGGSGGMDHKLTLSGGQEVPPVSTSASGSGTISVGADRSVRGSITTTGINATMAHIHRAAPGANGPVVIGLTKSGDNTWMVPAGTKFTDEQFDAYKAGNLYVNVHSAAYPGGELRAQIMPGR